MTPALTIDNLCAGYGQRDILTGVHLPPLQPGSMVALLGANAAGKSTLMRTLAGQLKYTGQAKLNGTDLSHLSADQRQRQIGYLPQTLPQPSGLLTYELILSAFRIHRRLTDDAPRYLETLLDDLGLREFALRPVRELSGGKRQLVGLAQVLVRQPQLLLLDEPTSALDLHWQLTVLQYVRQLVTTQQITALLALHDINLALRFCDGLVILHEGRVLSAGPANKALTVDVVEQAFCVNARIESCSKQQLYVLVDSPKEMSS